MLRQKSLCVIKEAVRDKNTITRNPSLRQINIDSLHRKTMQEQLVKRQLPQQAKKEKKVQNASKDKLALKGQSKEVKATTSRKHSPFIKQPHPAVANNLQLKKDLKQLVYKNAPSTFRKPSQQQMQFLKKIEKFREQRKKSEKSLKVKDPPNETESHRSNANSKQAKKTKEKVKDSSSKKTTLNTDKKTQPQPTSLNASKNIEGSQQQLKYHFGGLKNTRFSLDCNPVGVQKSQIEQALLAKPKKQESKGKKKQEDNPSFLEVFKKYKKSFDIDARKLQKMLKSQENEPVNTNQSRNGSSLSLITTKTKNTSDIINKLSANQPSKKESEPSCLASQSDLVYVKPKLCNKLIKMIDIQAPSKPGHYFSKEVKREGTQQKNESTTPASRENLNEESPCKDRAPMAQQKIVNFQLFSDEAGRENDKPTPLQEIPKSKENVGPQMGSEQASRQLLEKRFVGSKYYVQPLPVFVQKRENVLQFQSPIASKAFEDSLLGCEIALIERNITVDEQFDL